MPLLKVSSPDGTVVGIIEMDCMPAYCCMHSITIYKGAEKNLAGFWRKITKCAINSHCCCSVQCCGSIGKELDFLVIDSTGNTQEQLKKIHSGVYRECCTAGDEY